MEETTTTTAISVSEFEKLISVISEERQARIRFRMRGELWYPNFLRVMRAGEHNRVLFVDETRNHNIILSDLSSIVQFELNAAIHPFEPGCHYQVSQKYFTDQ